MLMIRLARVGTRKKPFYRLVVIEKDRARNGKALEIIGLYNPRTSPATFNMQRERVEYWASKGAQMTDRVTKLVKSAPVAPAAAVA